MSAWQQGGPGLHRPLDKLLATWTPVFPQAVLAEIQSRVAAVRAAQAPLQVQPPAMANGYGGGGGYGYVPVVEVPALGQQPGYSMQQQAGVPYAQQQAGYGGFQAPAYQQQQPQMQMQQPQPHYQHQQQQYPQQYQQQTQQGQQVSVPDLLSSLMNAGLLQPAGAPLVQGGGSGVLATPPHTGGATATPPYVGAAAAAAAPEREQPASSSFTPDRIKVQTQLGAGRPDRRPAQPSTIFLSLLATITHHVDLSHHTPSWLGTHTVYALHARSAEAHARGLAGICPGGPTARIAHLSAHRKQQTQQAEPAQRQQHPGPPSGCFICQSQLSSGHWHASQQGPALLRTRGARLRWWRVEAGCLQLGQQKHAHAPPPHHMSLPPGLQQRLAPDWQQ